MNLDPAESRQIPSTFRVRPEAVSHLDGGPGEFGISTSFGGLNVRKGDVRRVPIVPLILTFLFSTAAFARPVELKPATNLILSFEQWSKLSPQNQSYYLLGLQRIALDLEADDVAQHTEYQTAGLERRSYDVVMNLLVPNAIAGDANRRCVYAGWISELDVNGRYCLAPASTGCGRGQIQCNPLLYGAGKCTQTGRTATSYCNRNKKPITDIVKEIRALRADGQAKWAEFRESVGGYCSSPRPSQKTVCAMVRARVAELERVIGKGARTSPQPPVAATRAAKPVDVERASSGAVAPAGPGPSRTVVVRPVSSDSAAPPAAAPPVKPPPAAGPAKTSAATSPATGAASACEMTQLLANLADPTRTTRDGLNLMSVDSAQSLVCSTEPIPADWIAYMRERLATQIRATAGSTSEARFAHQNNIAVSKNFEACLKDANRLRAGGSLPDTTSRYRLTYTETCSFNVDDLATAGQVDYMSNGVAFMKPNVISWSKNAVLDGNLQMIRDKGVTLCQIQIVDPYNCAKNGSQQRPASMGVSGAAQ